jgi:hypothetical protein
MPPLLCPAAIISPALLIPCRKIQIHNTDDDQAYSNKITVSERFTKVQHYTDDLSPC